MAGTPRPARSSPPRKGKRRAGRRAEVGEGKRAVKFTPVVMVALAALAGCQARLTLEEAQARCTQQGGLLAVINTQQITASGVGTLIRSPGECVSPSKFGGAPPPAK